MNLNSDQLVAFFEVNRFSSFSKAARAMGLSQPALSQRIQKLEDQLKTPLFLRTTQSVKPTEAGLRLLRLYQNRMKEEEWFLKTLGGRKDNQLSGTLRIACFSSIARSAILPILHPLLQENESLQLDFAIREVYEMGSVLRSGRADFVFTQKPIEWKGVISQQLGEEKYVQVRAKKPQAKNSVLYFDHDPEDQTTFDFLTQSSQRKDMFSRSYVNDIYAILDAVERDWGRAIVPEHLVRGRSRLQIVEPSRFQKIPVFVNYYEQPFYSELQTQLMQKLENEISPLLR